MEHQFQDVNMWLDDLLSTSVHTHMGPACISGDQSHPLSLAALSICRSFAADLCAYLHVGI